MNDTIKHLEGDIWIDLANQQDLSDIIDIYNQAIMTKKSTAELKITSPEQKQSWFDHHMQKSNRPLYVVRKKYKKINTAGYIDSKIIGWACYSDLYEREAYNISSEISVYLDQNYQGVGLGKILARWLIEQAPKLGIHNVIAKIFAHNTVSVEMFKKLGFVQWGYLPSVCDMEDFLADVVIFGLVTKNHPL